MSYNSGIKDRRKERIRSLLEVTEDYSQEQPEKRDYREWGSREAQPPQREPDPEEMWKRGPRPWEEDGHRGGPGMLAGLMRRLIASLIVFGGIFGIFRLQEPWAVRTQELVASALTQDMDFAAVQVWYEEHFSGSPSFIPSFGADEEPAEKVSAEGTLSAPVAGTVIRPFSSEGQGIEVLPATAEDGISVTVKSIDTGRVLSVAKESSGGIRITVRHTGGLTAEYGHISGTRLAADDWLQGGDTIGWIQQEDTAAEQLLYFALMKENTYIDPAGVVSFD